MCCSVPWCKDVASNEGNCSAGIYMASHHQIIAYSSRSSLCSRPETKCRPERPMHQNNARTHNHLKKMECEARAWCMFIFGSELQVGFTGPQCFFLSSASQIGERSVSIWFLCLCTASRQGCRCRWSPMVPFSDKLALRKPMRDPLNCSTQHG